MLQVLDFQVDLFLNWIGGLTPFELTGDFCGLWKQAKRSLCNMHLEGLKTNMSVCDESCEDDDSYLSWYSCTFLYKTTYKEDMT